MQRPTATHLGTIALLAIILGTCRSCGAFHVGEDVPMMFRVARGRALSSWSDVRRSMLASFALDKTASFSPADLSEVKGEDVKLFVMSGAVSPALSSHRRLCAACCPLPSIGSLRRGSC